MGNSSVFSSILAPTSLIPLLLGKYGLSKDTTCQVLRTGINHSYLVIDGTDKYVFRLYSYNWRSEAEIHEELRFINLLKANDIAVSYPIADVSEKYLQVVSAPEGKRYAVLFSFADGLKVRNLTEANCRDTGILMSRIHRVSANQQLNRAEYSTEVLTKLPYQYAKEHFPSSLDEMKFVAKAGDHVTKVFQSLDNHQVRYGAVHLDIWYDNFAISEDAGITLFDFDFCGNGWLLLDIAYFCMQLFHTVPDKEKYKLKQEAFIAGYETLVAISEEEKRLLPVAGLAVWLFYLGVQSRRFNDWSNIFLTENYLKHYMGMVKTWLAYHQVEII